MANGKKQDLEIVQGKTYQMVFHWEEKPIVYKPITGVLQSAPVRITAVGHGLKSGWRAAVTNVKGMTEINAEANNIKDADYHAITVVDVDSIEMNDINAAGFKAYASGGILQYNSPVDLTGFTARMVIKNKVGGTVLASTEIAHAPMDFLTIDINNVTHTITLSILAVDTATFNWKTGVYDIEMVGPTGDVFPLCYGSVVVTKEVSN
jgi:hypothetical protein